MSDKRRKNKLNMDEHPGINSFEVVPHAFEQTIPEFEEEMEEYKKKTFKEARRKLKIYCDAKELLNEIEENLHSVCCTSQDYSGDMMDTIRKIGVIAVHEKIKELRELNNAITKKDADLHIYLVRRLAYLNDLKNTIISYES